MAEMRKQQRRGIRRCLFHRATIGATVVVLLAILAVGVWLTLGYREAMRTEARLAARDAQIEEDLGKLAAALKDYKHRHGTYPDSLSQVVGTTGFQGPVPVDPFSPEAATYSYESWNDLDLAVVYSVGADGEPNQGMRDIAEVLKPEEAGSDLLDLAIQTERTRDEPGNGIVAALKAARQFGKAAQDDWYLLDRLGYPEEVLAAGDTFAGSITSPTEYYEGLGQGLKPHQEAIALARKSVSQPTYTYVIRREEFSMGFETPVPQYLGFSAGSRIMVLQALHLGHEGDSEEAIRVCVDTIKWGSALASRGALVDHLVHLNGANPALTAIGALLPEVVAQEEFLGSVLDELQRIESQHIPISEAFLNWHKSYERLWEDLLARSVLDWQEVDPDHAILGVVGIRMWDEWTMERSMRQTRTLFEAMAAQAEGRDPGMDIDAYIEDLDPLIQVTIPNHKAALTREREFLSRLRGAQIMVALEIYRARHGKYPDSLEAVGGILAATPEDPFVDGTFGYQLTEDGYKLWSSGPDEMDEGGTVIYDPSNGTTSAGDVVIGE